jgi:hypothetical protein
MLWFTTPKRKENHDIFTYLRKSAIFLHFFSFAYCLDKMFTYICDVIKFTLNKGTAMTNAIETTKLNNRYGTTVLAKTGRFGLNACTYVNYKQATNAVERLKAAGVDAKIYNSGSVKFIEICK